MFAPTARRISCGGRDGQQSADDVDARGGAAERRGGDGGDEVAAESVSDGVNPAPTLNHFALPECRCLSRGAQGTRPSLCDRVVVVAV